MYTYIHTNQPLLNEFFNGTCNTWFIASPKYILRHIECWVLSTFVFEKGFTILSRSHKYITITIKDYFRIKLHNFHIKPYKTKLTLVLATLVLAVEYDRRWPLLVAVAADAAAADEPASSMRTVFCISSGWEAINAVSVLVLVTACCASVSCWPNVRRAAPGNVCGVVVLISKLCKGRKIGKESKMNLCI